MLTFQLKTFQGVRYSLFHYNERGAPGGCANFDGFTVTEPHPRGLLRPIPFGRTVSLAVFGGGPALAVGGETRFEVLDRGQGRVALRARAGFVSVRSTGGAGAGVRRPSGPEAGPPRRLLLHLAGGLFALTCGGSAPPVTRRAVGRADRWRGSFWIARPVFVTSRVMAARASFGWRRRMASRMAW